MVWYDQMFLGRRCRRRANLIKYQIMNREKHDLVYLVVLAQREHALLDIIPSVFLLQDAYPTDGMHIVGMGGSKEEALGLVQDMIREVYEADGSLDVYAYMQKYR